MLRKNAMGVLIIGLIFSLTLVYGCGGGGGGGGNGSSGSSPTPGPAPAPPENVSDKGIVMGKVVDETGAQVGTVGVNLDGGAVTTNEQGFFVMEKVLPGENKVLKYNKSGFMPGTTTVNVVAGQETFINLSLKKIGHTQQASGGANTTVTDTRPDGKNGSITIPANSVVDAAGAPVASYTAEITTLLPSDPNYTSLFPGRFLGGGAPGSTANPQPLQSYGVVNVDLKDAQGNRLNLASGAKATIQFPIDSDPVHDPATPTVPIWYLDEGTGIWVEEGAATRSGAFYTAEVGHLTPWNCDIIVRNQSIKTVEVVGMGGNLVQNAYVIVEGTGYRQTGFTGNAGSVQLLTTAGDTIRVWAEKGTLRSAVSTEIAASVGQNRFNRIELVEPLVIVTMSWAEQPTDLDSHMTGPEGVSGRFHVWYGGQGSLTFSPYCNLDTDDVTSFGPEIVTVSKLSPGVYRYSVHNYSGQGTFGMENSRCVVNLVIPKSGIIQRYDIPTSNPGNGNLWVVFELTVDNGGNISLTNVNQFTNTDPSGAAVD